MKTAFSILIICVFLAGLAIVVLNNPKLGGSTGQLSENQPDSNHETENNPVKQDTLAGSGGNPTRINQTDEPSEKESAENTVSETKATENTGTDLPEQPDSKDYTNDKYGFSLDLADGWEEFELPENAQSEIIVASFRLLLWEKEIPTSLNVAVQPTELPPDFESLEIKDVSPLIEVQISELVPEYQKETSKSITLNGKDAFELTYSFYNTAMKTRIKQKLITVISGDFFISFSFTSSEADFESNKSDFEFIASSITM
ncbi:MAG: hypothetical protein J7K00_01030 [Candidatus Diapherotrites archaeon]|nr:hypothetical protein [Candidatus Diapherotrites archaeon]